MFQSDKKRLLQQKTRPEEFSMEIYSLFPLPFLRIADF